MNRSQIIEAVEALRIRKCRPEREAIAHYILRKYGTHFQDIFSDLETIVDQGDLIKVEYKGSTSYRSPDAFDTKSSPLLTKHSKVLNSNRTVRFILSAVTELLAENSLYIEEGIPFESIQKRLIEYDSNRFSTENVRVFIDREIAVGTLAEGPRKHLLPKDLLPFTKEVKNTPVKMTRGRKPNATKTAESQSTRGANSSSSTPDKDAPSNATEVFAVKSVPTPVSTNKSVRSYSRKSSTTAGEKEEEKKLTATTSGDEAEGSVQSKNGDNTSSQASGEEPATGRSVRYKRKKEVFDPSDLPKKRASVPLTTPKTEKEKPQASVSKVKTETPVKVPKKPGRKKKQVEPEGDGTVEEDNANAAQPVAPAVPSEDVTIAAVKDDPKPEEEVPENTEKDKSEPTLETPVKTPKKPGRKKKQVEVVKDKKAEEDVGESKLKEDSKSTQPPVPASPPDLSTVSTTKYEAKEEEIPSDASQWTPSQVEAYFKKHGLREEGELFREQEIDGLSLLLMRRQDIVNGMKLLLGPALKVFKLVVKLQQSGGKVEESKAIL